MRLFKRNRSRGQAMVEFALIVPALVLGVFGIIDFGRLVYTQNSLNEASREAARAGAVFYRPAECGTQQRDACATTIAQNRLIGVIGNRSVTITCTRVSPLTNAMSVVTPTSGCAVPDLLKVSVTNNFTLLTPVIAQFLGSQTLRGEAQVTVQS